MKTVKELKFRAWNHIVGRMSPCYTIEELHKQKINFNNISLEQWSALFDGPGNEIYEGDILHYKTYDGGGWEKSGIDVYRVVKFGRIVVKDNSLYTYNGFYCTNPAYNDTDSIEYHLNHGAQVIGNIHEHHQLLLNQSPCNSQ